MKILFFDAVAYKPYSCKTLREEALGGSEASLLRAARALAKDGQDVSIYQLIDDQREPDVIEGIKHINGMFSETFDVVVHMRSAVMVEELRSMWPGSRHLVWMHDLGGEWLWAEPLDAADEIICVSEFHREQIVMSAPLGTSLPLPKFIYNIVEVDGARLDKVEGRLGFFSSPHKGLEQVVAQFKDLRVENPNLSLVVANPGYIPDAEALALGVVSLSRLPHCRVLEEMSRCQALFYPQTSHPETFGLVLAEANAMGVPVLCHDMGAAKEVLNHQAGMPNEVIDCTDANNVSEALQRILQRKDKVSADPRFTEAAVLAEWKQVLGL